MDKRLYYLFFFRLFYKAFDGRDVFCLLNNEGGGNLILVVIVPTDSVMVQHPRRNMERIERFNTHVLY